MATDAFQSSDQLTKKGSDALRSFGLLPELFNDPQYADVMPSDSSAAEVTFILGVVRAMRDQQTVHCSDRQWRGLDVGCGNGRLLAPLRQAGLRMDGIDTSRTCIVKLGARLPATELFVGDAATWRSPGRYNFGLAALNTVRYFGSIARLNDHFAAMWDNIREGGRYLVHLGISLDPYQSWSTSWTIGSRAYNWSVVGWDKVAGYVEERVVVDDSATGVVFDEIQIQVAVTPNTLDTALRSVGWRIDSCWNDRFEKIEFDLAGPGNLWLLLQKHTSHSDSTTPNGGD